MAATEKKAKKSVKKAKETDNKKVKKSKMALMWEKYPDGVLEIVDMRAVLK